MKHLAASLALASLLLPASLAAARTPQELLADRPLAPTDPALFSPSVYPDGPSAAPAAGGEPSDAEALRLLERYLAAEFPADPARRSFALAAFDDPAAREKIPSPTLRAALASLTGTLAERAIDFVLRAQTADGKPEVRRVRFVGESELSRTDLIAEVWGYGSSGEMDIRFNERYRGESPFLLTRVMAHEALHQDRGVADYEEAVAHALDELVYLGQLVRHPELATMGTELARENNTQALLRFNSGTGSALGLYRSNGGLPVLPASPTFAGASWWDWVDKDDLTATGGSALLGEYLASSRGATGPVCPSTAFDKALLDCMDEVGSGSFTHEELMAVAHALKLGLDEDGDGVFGTVDECPSIAGSGADGCPPLKWQSAADKRADGEIGAALGRDLREIARALRRMQIGGLLRRGGVDVWHLRALTAGRFRLELTAADRPRGRRVLLIARGSAAAPWPGGTRLDARLTGRGRALLRRARRPAIEVRLSFTPRAGRTQARARTISLHRG